MEMTAKEVRSVSHNNRDIKSTGVSFGGTWNSRGWQAKEGVVSAIAQKIVKIIYIARKTISCRDCQIKV